MKLILKRPLLLDRSYDKSEFFINYIADMQPSALASYEDQNSRYSKEFSSDAVRGVIELVELKKHHNAMTSVNRLWKWFTNKQR